MDTSRVIRGGSRIYGIRIDAVSQEHVPGCITHKVPLAANEMVLVLASKLTWFWCWHQN